MYKTYLLRQKLCPNYPGWLYKKENILFSLYLWCELVIYMYMYIAIVLCHFEFAIANFIQLLTLGEECTLLQMQNILQMISILLQKRVLMERNTFWSALCWLASIPREQGLWKWHLHFQTTHRYVDECVQAVALTCYACSGPMIQWLQTCEMALLETKI